MHVFIFVLFFGCLWVVANISVIIWSVIDVCVYANDDFSFSTLNRILDRTLEQVLTRKSEFELTLQAEKSKSLPVTCL